MLLKIKSIRFKLVITFILLIFFSIFFTVSFFYTKMDSVLSSVTVEYLTSEMQTAIKLIHDEKYDVNEVLDFLSHQTITYKGPYSIKYALFSDVVDVLSISEDFRYDLQSLSKVVNGADYQVRSLHGKYYLTEKFTIDTRTYYLQYMVNPEGHREALDVFKQTAFFSIPVILTLIALSTVALYLIVFLPLNRLFKVVDKSEKNTNKDYTGLSEFKVLEKLFFDALNRSQTAYERILDFTSDVSHELRLPITAMKGEALISIEKDRTVAEYKDVLCSIVEELDRLMSIINRLLKLTRTDSNVELINREPVNLVSLLENIVEYFEVLALEKKVGIQFSSEYKSIILNVDTQMLNEVFINLIDNAIKYNVEGGMVVISISEEENSVRICVEDNGIGISEESQKKVFNRFYRVNKSRTRESSGFGLGLSIVKGFIKAHDGEISLDSKEGHGTIFTIVLPK